jgi:hypothetical protein
MVRDEQPELGYRRENNCFDSVVFGDYFWLWSGLAGGKEIGCFLQAVPCSDNRFFCRRIFEPFLYSEKRFFDLRFAVGEDIVCGVLSGRNSHDAQHDPKNRWGEIKWY